MKHFGQSQDLCLESQSNDIRMIMFMEMNTTSGISAAVKPFREVPTYYFGSRNYGVMCVQVILVKDEYIRGVAWWVALL